MIKLPANAPVGESLPTGIMDERQLIAEALRLLNDIPENIYPYFDGLVSMAYNSLEKALMVSAFDKDYKKI